MTDSPTAAPSLTKQRDTTAIYAIPSDSYARRPGNQDQAFYSLVHSNPTLIVNTRCPPQQKYQATDTTSPPCLPAVSDGDDLGRNTLGKLICGGEGQECCVWPFWRHRFCLSVALPVMFHVKSKLSPAADLPFLVLVCPSHQKSWSTQNPHPHWLGDGSMFHSHLLTLNIPFSYTR